MATEAQTEANRKNAQKSTGPKTIEGKAAVAKNALKHGLFTNEAVIAGESIDDYNTLRADTLEELSPVGNMETILAERIVSLTWRLKRVERFQSIVIDAMIDSEVNSPAKRIYKKMISSRLGRSEEEENNPDLILGNVIIEDYTNSRVLDRLSMYERRIENSLFKTSKELDRRKLMRQLEIANAQDEPAEYERTDHPHPFGMRLPHERDGSSLPQGEEADTLSEQNNAKQSQPPPSDINVTTFIKDNYSEKSHSEPAQKQSQLPAFGRKSEVLNKNSARPKTVA